MENKTYKTYLSNYINSQIRDLEMIKNIDVPDFHNEEIDCSLISEEYFERLCKKLSAKCLTKDSSVLYYFTYDVASPEEIIKKIQKRKKAKKTGTKYLALPKVNTSVVVSDEKVLYVGKTNSNFISRLKSHFGLSSSTTYSLQLKYWACEVNLKLKLYYTIVPSNKESLRFMEPLETVLHGALKPLLGRAGH